MISNRMKNLNPYIPGEQPKDRDYIKLNANESPYPPSSAIIEGTADFIKKNPIKLALYPDPDSFELRKAIADMLNKTGGVLCRAVCKDENICPSYKDEIPFSVTADMIFAGNGSDEVLSFLFYAFFDNSAKIVLPEFTYSFYPVYAGFYGIKTDIVPLLKDWTLDKESMLSKAAENNCGIIFANPNAPTGIGISREAIRQMLLKASSDRIFIVDEAYVDFGGESCISLLAEFENLIVVRTFSKSFSSAGMRLGYIVANPELIKTVTTVKNSFNHFPVDAVAQVTGSLACRNSYYYADCAVKICKQRASLTEFLRERGWFVIDSCTNFIFTKKTGFSGEYIYIKLKEEGILVRHFFIKGIEDFVRITIGTESQMDRLKEAIKNCNF